MTDVLLLTVEEAAERLRIGRTVMYDLVRSRRIRTIKIGRLRRVPVNALQAYIDQLEIGDSDFPNGRS